MMVFRLSPPVPADAQKAEVVNDTDRRHERIRAAMVQQLFQHGWASISISFGLTLACWVASAWARFDSHILIWAALMHGTQAVQALLLVHVRRQKFDALTPSTFWLHRHLSVLLISSVGWGLAPLMLWPNAEFTSTTLWGVILQMVVAGAGARAVAVSRAAIYVWLLPLVSLAILFLLTQHSFVSTATASVVLCFGLMVLYFAHVLNSLLAKEQLTKLDNDALVMALRKQVTLVEQATREKSRFLGSASHDLRQPMHALGLFAATLDKQLNGTALQPTVMNMIRSIDALEQSFSAMLDISKLDAGIIEPNLQPFPIRDLFRVLHMHCAGQAEELGLGLRFKPGGKIVTSDPHLLQRVLSNLIHNAIRYTHKGGIVVVARTRRSGISIEVWDTGMGISEEEIPKIFDEFYQASNPSRNRSHGLGMGLAIVKRLVFLLGHSLEVSSEPGRGSVFRILIKPSDLADMDNILLAADTVPAIEDANRVVLLIDDEESIRTGMSDLLQTWGYQVLMAATIAEACTEVRRHAGVIDLVLSDLRLANDEDGIQAIERVRAVYGAPLPALLITGDTSPEEVKRIHDSGHQVLFKPVRTRELYTALRNVP